MSKLVKAVLFPAIILGTVGAGYGVYETFSGYDIPRVIQYLIEHPSHFFQKMEYSLLIKDSLIGAGAGAGFGALIKMSDIIKPKEE